MTITDNSWVSCYGKEFARVVINSTPVQERQITNGNMQKVIIVTQKSHPHQQTRNHFCNIENFNGTCFQL